MMARFLTVSTTGILHVAAQNTDLFNFALGSDHNTCEGGDPECSRPSFAQEYWEFMRCDDPATCTGFSNKFPTVSEDPTYGWRIEDQGNNCKWCPFDMSPKTCGVHKQSPINLMRFPAEDDHPEAKECIDWHWMQYRDGTCKWENMLGQFTIERHALQLHMPTRTDGTLDCLKTGFGRQWPRLDYSKGFPHWWWLARTDITTPSQHNQEGFQYAAEVTLAHFYSEKAHIKNEMGHVTLFMQDYPDEEPWPFLDKLICQWREEEETVRQMCGRDPAPIYANCRLFRGQTRTEAPSPEPTREPTTHPFPSPELSNPQLSEQDTETRRPPRTKKRTPRPPTKAPTPSPTKSPTEEEADVAKECDENCPNGNCRRMCSGSHPCCRRRRSDTAFCWNVYENHFPGVQIFGACEKCCNSKKPKRKKFFAKPIFTMPKKIKCSDYSTDMQRFCKPGSCCSSPRSTTRFCSAAYDKYPYDDFKQLCHYCCNPSIDLPPPDTRNLGVFSNSSMTSQPLSMLAGNSDSAQTYMKGSVRETAVNALSSSAPFLASISPPNVSRYEELEEDSYGEIQQEETSTPITQRARRSIKPTTPGSHSDIKTTNSSNMFYVDGRFLKLTEKDYEPFDEDPKDYFNKIYGDYKERHWRLNQGFQENYDDVHYWPYEWMLKVGTEYYFRYEGTQVVPPCRQIVHWRIMKDPIRVHKRQIDELNRLLAWRINPDTCTAETAGTLYDNGNKVNVKREIQYTHKNHRKVFCECKDWPSQFEGDQVWCTDWKTDKKYNRFYIYPYSFPTYLWLPGEANPYITRA